MKIQFTRNMVFAKKSVKIGQIIDVASDNVDAILSLRSGWATLYKGKAKADKNDDGNGGDDTAGGDE